jgi:hypothetical protein
MGRETFRFLRIKRNRRLFFFIWDYLLMCFFFRGLKRKRDINGNFESMKNDFFADLKNAISFHFPCCCCCFCCICKVLRLLLSLFSYPTDKQTSLRPFFFLLSNNSHIIDVDFVEFSGKASKTKKKTI